MALAMAQITVPEGCEVFNVYAEGTAIGSLGENIAVNSRYNTDDVMVTQTQNQDGTITVTAVFACVSRGAEFAKLGLAQLSVGFITTEVYLEVVYG